MVTILFHGVCREVGCGKTTVTKALADYMNKDQVQFQMISNPALGPEDLLKAILLKLGGKAENGSKTLMLDQLQKILFENWSAGRFTVLAIDEAHVIGNQATLDELRMLLNFQTDDEFLLTLIVLGQPPVLRTISELLPLDLPNTVRYLMFRLKNVGATRGIFSRQAVELLYEFTGGIPLRIPGGPGSAPAGKAACASAPRRRRKGGDPRPGWGSGAG